MNTTEAAADGMMCNVCKKLNIAPPGGFYMCDNFHMQCTPCYNNLKHHCGICNEKPKYFQLENNDETLDVTLTPSLNESDSNPANNAEVDDTILSRTVHEDYDDFNAVQ